MDAKEIVARFSLLEMLRKNVEQVWNDVERYIMPLRLGDFFQVPQTEQSIQWQREDIYDTTAIVDAQDMAANVHGALTNPVMKWLNMKWRYPSLQEDKESREWMELLVETMYDELYDCNFDSELGSAYQDLIGCGNTCMTVEPEVEVGDDPSDWDGLNFSAIALREIYFEQDHRGRLGTFYRKLQWTPRQIRSKAESDPYFIVPPEIQKLIDDPGSIDVRVTIIYCVYYRPNMKMNAGEMVLAESARPVASKYVLRDGAIDISKERGLYEMPAFICRWEKTSGTMWGFGPGTIMSPTAKYINSWMQMEDMAARKQVDPPTLVQERGLMSDLDQQPGGQTVVRDIEKSVKIFNQLTGGMDLSMKKLDELRNMLHEAFKKNQFSMKDKAQISATEAMILYELMNRVLGPSVGRIQNELLSPMMHRVARLLIRNKQMPPPTNAMKAAGKKAKWKFIYGGPLMRAQKSDNATNVERWLASILGAAKVIPKIVNRIDEGKVAQVLGDDYQIPSQLIRSDAEVAIIEKAQDAHQLQMAKAQAAQETGKGMQSLAAGAQATQQVQPDAGGQQ